MLHEVQSYFVNQSSPKAESEINSRETKIGNDPTDWTDGMNKKHCSLSNIRERIKNFKIIQEKKLYAHAKSPFSEKPESGASKNAVEKVNADLANEIETTSENHKPFLGLFFIFLSSVTFTLACALMKSIPQVTPGQISFGRNAVCVCGGLPIAVYLMKNILRQKEGNIQLVIGALFGTTALYLETIAYKILPLTDVAIAFACVPFMTVIVARFYLKELCNLAQSVALVMAFCGVLLSIRLPKLLQERSGQQFDQIYLLGLAVCAGAVVTSTATFVTLRKMKQIHFSVIMVWYGCIGMIENAVINGAMSAYVPPTCGRGQFTFLAICGLDFLANTALVSALQVENAGIISVERASLEIVAAMFFQTILLGESIDMYNIIGATLVIASLSILAVKNWLLMLPDRSNVRKRLKCFLL